MVDGTSKVARVLAGDRESSNVTVEWCGKGIAGGVRGLGSGDVPRRMLTELDVLDIVDAEIADRVDHARQYDTLDQTTAADQLRAEAAVLESYLAS